MGDPRASRLPAAPELSQLLVHLLKGVIYREDDERCGRACCTCRRGCASRRAVLLLELVLDEAEGYAFLKSRPDPDDDEGAPRLPRLVARRPLSYPVSLLLALLRKKLAEFDAGGGDTRLILEREQIVDLLRLFLPETANEARLVDQVDAHIGKAVELGFCGGFAASSSASRCGASSAFVDAQWLADFEARLAEYRRYVENPDAAGDDGDGR
jgi:hypothetical protein